MVVCGWLLGLMVMVELCRRRVWRVERKREWPGIKKKDGKCEVGREGIVLRTLSNIVVRSDGFG